MHIKTIIPNLCTVNQVYVNQNNDSKKGQEEMETMGNKTMELLRM